jgi:hypothetical protein
VGQGSIKGDIGIPHVRAGLTEAFIVLGGIAAVAGSLLDWFRIRIGLAGAAPFLGVRTTSQSGIDGPDGKITLVAGGLVVLTGLLMFLWTSGARRIATGVAGLLGGLAAAGLSAYDAATPQQRFIEANAPDLAERTGIPVATARRLYQGLFDSGTVRISLRLGILVVIAGGIIAALSAAFALGKSPDEPNAEQAVDDAKGLPQAPPLAPPD